VVEAVKQQHPTCKQPHSEPQRPKPESNPHHDNPPHTTHQLRLIPRVLRLQRATLHRQLVVRLPQRLPRRQRAAADEGGERVRVAAGGADGALEGDVLGAQRGELLAELGELFRWVRGGSGWVGGAMEEHGGVGLDRGIGRRVEWWGGGYTAQQ